MLKNQLSIKYSAQSCISRPNHIYIKCVEKKHYVKLLLIGTSDPCNKLEYFDSLYWTFPSLKYLGSEVNWNRVT